MQIRKDTTPTSGLEADLSLLDSDYQGHGLGSETRCVAQIAALSPRRAAIWDHRGRMPDPRPQADDSAHDVLAAEEFGVPAPDPGLNHSPVMLPEDPTGIAEPHDVLAAEEFALPAPRYGGGEPYGVTRGTAAPSRRTSLLLFALALVILRRRGRRRRAASVSP